MRPGRTALLWLALVATIWGCVLLVTGGFVWELGSFRLSSRTASRPFIAATALLAFHLLVFGRSTTLADLAALGRQFSRPSFWAALAAVAALAVGLVFGTRAVGGSDSYGYMSQADLWLRGDLTVEQPFVEELPWRNAALTMTPIAYIPTGQAGTYVPMYPPGLPMTLALFKLIGGEWAAFLVVPLLGTAAVWLTFRLGRMLYNEQAGAMAAVVLATSPTFLFMLVSAPMSDIPAMTWWLVSVTAIVKQGDMNQGRHILWLIASGLSAAIAILTRPNLAPLVAMLIALIFFVAPSRAVALRRAAIWLLPALTGPVFFGVFNSLLFGSPLSFGYGAPIAAEFSLSHVWPNLQRYLGWLAYTETPFALAGILTPFVFLRARASRMSIRLMWWCLAFSSAVLAAYLPYTVFGVWWYLRFLLPGYPTMFVAGAIAVVALSRAAGMFRQAIPVVLVAFVVWHGVRFANDANAFSLADGEERYKEAGDLVKTLPPNTVVLSFQHSGSLRYYANITTMRFDTMPEEWLDKAIDHLSTEGHPVYAVLDGWEVDLIRKRFGPLSPLSWLARGPIQITRHDVHVYEIAQPKNKTAVPGEGRP